MHSNLLLAGTEALSLPEPTMKGVFRHWLLLVLVLCWVALAYMPLWRTWSDRLGLWVQLHSCRVGCAIVGLFLLLVSLGVTGSSMQLLLNGPWNNGGSQGTIEFKGQKDSLFEPRGVRSDEWLVLAPNTLAQWNHEPQFPIVNSNLGLQGQNMGVIGMTGVPIAQPAAVARPATWGYFALPLRQALSWQWQLPFFACLFFLWKALGLLNPRHPGFNLLLSLIFCVQPYAAGWSLWPLYVTAFPLALLVSAVYMLRASHIVKALSLGLVMGILLAGWTLVLYPPWQITVGTLLAVVAAGWVADNRRVLQFRSIQWLGLGFAVVIAAGLLGSWWLDTQGAIALIRETVYPGARTAMQGGDLSVPWWTLRGYLNPEALPFGTGPGINQSEISAYIFLPLPVFFLGLWHCSRFSLYRWTICACMGFLVFCLVFRFVGIPLWLAKASLWSYVTSSRLDLAVALACTFIMAMVYSGSADESTPRQRIVPRWVGILVAITGSAMVVWEFEFLPPGVLIINSLPLMAAMAVAVGYGSWWMLQGRMRASASLMLVLCMVSTAVFNPLSKAPRSVQLSASSAALASDSKQHRKPTLVISDSSTPSMMLAAAGAETIGGVFYYPHRDLWVKMGLAEQDWPVVNRYQHLTFSVADRLMQAPFAVNSPQLDVVNVEINPKRFDFSSTGAQRVAALEKDAVLLRHSPFLTEVGHYGGWFWFSVDQPG